MRKYIIRKNFDEKNMDPLNVPQRSVFFQKKQESFGTISNENPIKIKQTTEQSTKVNSTEVNSTEVSKKQETKLEENKISNTFAKKIFNESFTAISESEKKRVDSIYSQLDTEKKISKELNEKLHNNLTKIANVEMELLKKKNQLEGKLEEKTKQLIESERYSAIGELSSRISHDLRNPLVVIMGTIEILKHKKGKMIDDAVIKRLELMESSIFRMTHQIDRVLNYVQKLQLELKTESLKMIIEDSLSLINMQSNIRILPPENNITLKLDYEKMKIVFENILLNSIQVIDDQEGKIIIKNEENNNSVIITIQDSGKGISDDDLCKIFEPLFTTKQEGTGLGLSCVKSIIEQHGGTVSIKSRPTTVTIILPKK
ncbi:MAG: histidine kinase [Thaumarchaeota archaeon]|nr:MAG: histidine kinase [Nitrososphaerota archaeon]PBO86180.1 MAG: histidine kinase [Nitrososphaerota archaeon]